MEFRIGHVECVSTSNHAHDYRLLDATSRALRVNAPHNDHSEQRAIAAFITDALNVHNETGLSPRELLARNQVLLAALKDVHHVLWEARLSNIYVGGSLHTEAADTAFKRSGAAIAAAGRGGQS